MKTDIEVIRFGYTDEMYAVAEKHKGMTKEDPTSLRIFEVEGENRPPKDLYIYGSASVQKLRDFLNSLYEPQKHAEGCACVDCINTSTMKMLLQEAVKLFNGLELNRDEDNPSMVNHGKHGLLYADIARLEFTIRDLLEPHE